MTNPSLLPRATPHGGAAGRPAARRLALWVLALTAIAAAGAASADPPSDTQHKTKPSSFAPRHDRSHVYGAPVGKPILHKRKKRPRAAAPAGAPAAPIK